MKRLSILRGAGNREKVKFAPVAEQGIRSMFKPCRGNLMRVQVSPGAFSQCVGIWKTRLTQNQLLKSVQVQVLSLRFYGHYIKQPEDKIWLFLCSWNFFLQNSAYYFKQNFYCNMEKKKYWQEKE